MVVGHVALNHMLRSLAAPGKQGPADFFFEKKKIVQEGFVFLGWLGQVICPDLDCFVALLFENRMNRMLWVGMVPFEEILRAALSII